MFSSPCVSFLVEVAHEHSAKGEMNFCVLTILQLMGVHPCQLVYSWIT